MSTKEKINISPDNIIAYFQPILSADSKSVYSYEILGRFIDGGGTVRSLGPFFNDPGTTHEEALRVDRIVRRHALKKYAEEKRSEYLFINLRLAWILQQRSYKPAEMEETLRWAREFGISPDRFVIEITEEEFNACGTCVINGVTHSKCPGSRGALDGGGACVYDIIRSKCPGCRIALDDYGKQASDIERLAMLEPDIIKINMEYIHRSETSYHYREHLRSIAAFADAVGIEVLYEGVETQRQLDICMSLRGRYYQGFYIAYPQPSMRNAFVNDRVFSASIENAYAAVQDAIAKTEDLKKYLDIEVERFVMGHPFDSGATDYGAYITGLFGNLLGARLVYLCGRRGNQLAYCDGAGFDDSEECRNTNWGWRLYFHEMLKSVAAGQKSYLSAAYHDFVTKEKVRTYSYEISGDVFLFVDIGTV